MCWLEITMRFFEAYLFITAEAALAVPVVVVSDEGTFFTAELSSEFVR